MATVVNEAKLSETHAFQVIHPLDDVREEKCSLEGLGEIKMNGAVKAALYTLRGYLLLMGLLVGDRLLTLAGALGHHAR